MSSDQLISIILEAESLAVARENVLATWAGAVGATAAIVATGGIALASWAVERKRRYDSARATVAVARLVATRARIFLTEEVRPLLSPSSEITTAQAAELLTSGRLLELMSTIEEVRLSDLPTPEAVSAYMDLRTQIRKLEGALRWVSGIRAHAVRLNVTRFQLRIARAATKLRIEAVRFQHPFWPNNLFRKRSASEANDNF